MRGCSSIYRTLDRYGLQHTPFDDQKWHIDKLMTFRHRSPKKLSEVTEDHVQVDRVQQGRSRRRAALTSKTGQLAASSTFRGARQSTTAIFHPSTHSLTSTRPRIYRQFDFANKNPKFEHTRRNQARWIKQRSFLRCLESSSRMADNS